MQIYCPACHNTFSFEGAPPKFCSQCGKSLPAVSQPFDASQSTIPIAPPDPAEMATLPPQKPSSSTARPDFETIASREYAIDELPPDATIGPYSIVKKLGQGGMGTVFEAKHANTGQPVALKLLSRATLATDDSVERFQRESQIAASINHPRSTFVYEAGQFDDQFYITMELMSGGTLKDVIESQGPLPVEKAVDFILDIIDGLQRAHDAGIVHRDLKPSNCFIAHDGRAKIGDFGLAKSFVNDSSLTRTGTFMGTPQFAAPEQLRASEVDERADIYALGGTLFYLLSGRAPFVGHAAQVIASIASDPPPNIRQLVDSVPQDLARAIQQALEKDPSKRQQNLLELRNVLLPFSTRGASKADLGRRLAAFFIDALLAGFVVLVFSQFSGIAMILTGNWFGDADLKRFNLTNIFLQFGVLLAYFAIPEWRFGRTIGKWLMGMRVIDRRNEPPRLLPAIIRAVLVPGLSQLSVTITTYMISFNPQLSADPAEAVRMIVTLQLVQVLSWIPSLICMSTARQKNGFRGIHDLVTGTRVVRLAGALEFRRPQNVPVTVPVAIDSSARDIPQLDSMDVVGRYAREHQPLRDFFLAKDRTLDRDVWALEVDEFGPATADPVSQRSTKIRTVARRESKGHKWLITEALKGCPLLEFICQSRQLGWTSLLPVLQEVVEELIASERPLNENNCSLDQIWIDLAGRVTFLTGFDNQVSAAKRVSPIEVVRILLNAIIENHVIPEHVLSFRDQLPTADDPEALRRIKQQLESMEDRPSSWQWDDRLGVAAATFGMEYSPFFSLVFVALLLAAFNSSLSVETLGAATFALASLLVLAGGYIFRGGPAFRFSGISVRQHRTLKPASPVRCAIRNWISWLPVIFFLTSFDMLVHFAIVTNEQQSKSLEVSLPPMFLVLLIGILPLGMVILLGIGYSIIRPSRGIADLICGTRLMRK
jgi:uncharacterized RDD family membrane protein YckC